MKRHTYRKRDFPLDQIRRYLEPGPIVLVSSAWRGNTNIMTMGWHMMLGFSPALFACYIWEAKPQLRNAAAEQRMRDQSAYH
jgi:flavin reductase (DIM6/NTAB) family NADH-FMN oxidoreductase RutF